MSLVFRILTLSIVFASNSGLAQKSVVFADGGPVVLTDKGFSIVPPVGWEIITDYTSTSLVTQPTFTEGMRYQRTIQVVSKNKSIEIGPQMAEEYGQSIISKFGQSSANIEGYRIRNFLPVTLRDGNEGVLYYAEFSLDGTELMQAHMLVASKTRHYLVTFTDLAEHFESGEGSKDFLSVAWDSMISFKVDSAPGFRITRGIKAIAGGGTALLLLLMFWFLRFRKQAAIKKYQNMMIMEGTDEKVYESTVNSTSQMSHSPPMPPESAFENVDQMLESSSKGASSQSAEVSESEQSQESDKEMDGMDFDDEADKAG